MNLCRSESGGSDNLILDLVGFRIHKNSGIRENSTSHYSYEIVIYVPENISNHPILLIIIMMHDLNILPNRIQCNLYKWGLYKWGTSLSGAILLHIRSFPYEWTSISGVVGNGGPRILKFTFNIKSNLYIWESKHNSTFAQIRMT